MFLRTDKWEVNNLHHIWETLRKFLLFSHVKKNSEIFISDKLESEETTNVPQQSPLHGYQLTVKNRVIHFFIFNFSKLIPSF